MLSIIFRYFVIISSWKKAETFIWTNLNPLHSRMLCAKFSRDRPGASGEEEHLISSTFSPRNFFIIIPRKRTELFIWTNWNPFTQECFVSSFVEIDRVHGSGEEDFSNFVNGFFTISLLPPFWRGRTLHLNKHEFSLPKDAFCQEYLKLELWFWRRKLYSISSMYFRCFVIISPWKKCEPFFEQTWIPFIQGSFVPRLIEIGLVVLEKKVNLWKLYIQKDGQTTDNRRSENLTWSFSSGELKTGPS